MRSAYIYVRVSTDEQKRKGHSLIEQEERLVKYCEFNDIKINGIYREDYSAKNFNRPEWKKLIKTIRRNRDRPLSSILFIKWDRFSRSTEFAYQMIRTLKELNINPIAIDQPVDLDIPESIVMLAVYLSIPEAENCRRGLTTSDGIRRAKKMGRWAGKAPIGYTNRTEPDGKKFIMPKQPEADHIRWSFEQLATGMYTMSQVRRMACVNGLRCERNNFWKLVRNPIYCGIIRIRANRNEDEQFIMGIHEPLISEQLFQQVQLIIHKDHHKRALKESLKALFPLRGFFSCPWCGRKVTGSVSQGKRWKYPYYHCTGYRCKGRFRADRLNDQYEEQLKSIQLRPSVYELFELVLEDENVLTRRREQVDQRREILNEIEKQEYQLLKTRKYFLDEKIEMEDFINLKKDFQDKLYQLNGQLKYVTLKLKNCIRENATWPLVDLNLLRSYKEQDIKGKRDIVSLFTPSTIIRSLKNLTY